jgi:hypothetical protein
MPSCVKNCDRKFANDAALSRHRKACPVLKCVRQRSQDIRREKGIGGHQDATTTLGTRKQRLQVSNMCDLLLYLQILQAHLLGKALQPPAMNKATPKVPMDIDTDDLQSGSFRPPDSPPNFGADIALEDPDPQDPTSSPNVESQPALTQTGRPRRNYRLPKRFKDILPSPTAPPEIPDPPAPPKRTVLLVVRDRLITATNIFGIWRDYPRRPSYDPDVALTLEDLTPQPVIRPSQLLSQNPVDTSEKLSAYWPFPNASIHGIMKWLNNGQVNKSEADANDLVHNIIRNPDFNPTDLAGFDAHRENLRLDKALSAEVSLRTQFNETAVEILVPSGDINRPAQTFSVPGLLHRKLTSVISDAFNSPLAHMYHFSPFKLFRKSPVTQKEERIYGELYNSDSFLAEHEEIQRHGALPPDEKDCKREKVVAALMLSSDATHLTQFGVAKGWPIYFMVGNLSKYMRAQPSCGALHHLAYIPSVSDLLRFAAMFVTCIE